MRALIQLRGQEIEEARILKQLQEKFPGEEIDGPAVAWEDLSATERHVAHYVAHRGRVYRVPSLLPAFAAASGITLTEFGFRHHLTRLVERGVLVRAHPGWAVHERYLLKAREPQPPPQPRGGMSEVVRRARAAPESAWSPGSSIARRGRGVLSPALQALYDRTPADRAFTVDDVLDGPAGRDRVSLALRRLLEEKRLVRLAHGIYARAGVEIVEVPLPAQLRVALAALPVDQAISLCTWAERATGKASEEAIDAMQARAALLKRQGRIQEIGDGLYRRKQRALPPAEPSGDLPPDLVALLAKVPERDPIRLGALELAMDGERARVSGQVYRLVQRGILERCAVQTYRRVHGKVPEAGLLRHFEPGVVMRAAEVLMKDERRFTASGLARVTANLGELVARGKLEQAAGGFRLVGAKKREEPAEEAVEKVGAREVPAPAAEPVIPTSLGGITPDATARRPPLAPTTAVDGYRDLARILWALDWAQEHGMGPVTPAEIARICTEKAGVHVRAPNIARFLRVCKGKGRTEERWVEERGRYRRP